jgi:hypothetical protein
MKRLLPVLLTLLHLNACRTTEPQLRPTINGYEFIPEYNTYIPYSTDEGKKVFHPYLSLGTLNYKNLPYSAFEIAQIPPTYRTHDLDSAKKITEMNRRRIYNHSEANDSTTNTEPLTGFSKGLTYTGITLLWIPIIALWTIMSLSIIPGAISQIFLNDDQRTRHVEFEFIDTANQPVSGVCTKAIQNLSLHVASVDTNGYRSLYSDMLYVVEVDSVLAEKITRALTPCSSNSEEATIIPLLSAKDRNPTVQQFTESGSLAKFENKLPHPWWAMASNEPSSKGNIWERLGTWFFFSKHGYRSQAKFVKVSNLSRDKIYRYRIIMERDTLAPSMPPATQDFFTLRHTMLEFFMSNPNRVVPSHPEKSLTSLTPDMLKQYRTYTTLDPLEQLCALYLQGNTDTTHHRDALRFIPDENYFSRFRNITIKTRP